MAKEITSRAENYSDWYIDIVKRANLADNSAVRGCMVIKPHGFAIWENIRDQLDKMFKETGHVNAYFPLFIPKSFLSKEAQHVDGFAKECAVVTHHRLMNAPDGSGVVVDPTAKLEEELIVRPTSETIIWDTYRTWINSYRDLPLLINQWANVVRWEMRTRLFLRTTEFLWQEGHTAHATKAEAEEETLRILDIYATFAEEYMAMPVIRGIKTANERFAKAFDVKFSNENNQQEFVWATSWGVSTRLMGGLIMTHSDDDGLVIPPKLAPTQVVIIPIPKPTPTIDEVAKKIMADLKAKGIRVKYDTDLKTRPGFKFAEHELHGIPIRLAIGERDLANGQVEVARRDTKEKMQQPLEGIEQYIEDLLVEIQANLFNRAKAMRDANITKVETFAEFEEVINRDIPGFISAHWDGTTETEEKIKELTKATIRCIPLDAVAEDGVCVLTGKPSQRRVLFAKSY